MRVVTQAVAEELVQRVGQMARPFAVQPTGQAHEGTAAHVRGDHLHLPVVALWLTCSLVVVSR